MAETKADGRKTRREGAELVRTLLFLAALLAGRSTLADHYHVPTGSMEPTLRVGDHLLVDKRAYGLRVPFTRWRLWDAPAARGDVVVFDSPVDERVWVKRIVGVPGDTVSFDGGVLVLNDRPVPHFERHEGRLEALPGCPHPVYPEPSSGPSLPPTRIPEGSYLVMGDHRGASLDGRSFGLLEERRLLGKVVSVLFTRRGGLPLSQRLWLPLTECMEPDGRLFR